MFYSLSSGLVHVCTSSPSNPPSHPEFTYILLWTLKCRAARVYTLYLTRRPDLCETEGESMLWLTNMSRNMKTDPSGKSAVACAREPLDGHNLSPTLASGGWHDNAEAAVAMLVIVSHF